uniref:CX domain-containing protein n=1 Tax=Setaria digitata TaxID=48799 RepID=A0A915PVG1_9BILA
MASDDTINLFISNSLLSFFRNLRNYLQSIADVKNDSSRIALSNNDIYYDDLKYQLYTYEKVIELPTTGKLCHLKVFNVEELGNIFIKNSEKPVDHIYWICPPSNWCCGAECCRHYYKNPWPILGPELCVLLISAVVFASTLAILRLYRRWQQRQLGQETVSTTISLINSEHV